MPRPRKHRRLRRKPHQLTFKPVGIPLESLDRVTLLHEELEALRLADLEGLHQADGAKEMGISRSTFQRIVSEARHKVALALVDGKALQVKGGTFLVTAMRWHCMECGNDWDLFRVSQQSQPQVCPACGSLAIRQRPGEERRHLE